MHISDGEDLSFLARIGSSGSGSSTEARQGLVMHKSMPLFETNLRRTRDQCAPGRKGELRIELHLTVLVTVAESGINFHAAKSSQYMHDHGSEYSRNLQMRSSSAVVVKSTSRRRRQ